jgi:hypothetical protein
MENVIPLSGGNAATLRTSAELTERQRRPVTNALALVSPQGQVALDASYRLRADAKLPEDDKKRLKAEERAVLAAQVQFTKGDVENLDASNDLAIVAFTKHWTRSEAITLESVLDLPGPDYDALREAVAPLAAELFVKFSPSKNSDSPTAPSSDSATRSEGPAELSIVPQTSGEPTSSSKSA